MTTSVSPGLISRATSLWQRLGNRALVMGAILALGTTGLGMVIPYAVQVLLARTLGVSEYGIYVTALGWLNFAQLFSTLDLGSASLRFVAIYRREGQWSLVRGFIHRSRAIVFGASVIASLVAAMVLMIAPATRVSPATRGAALMACVLLPIASLLQLELNVLQGFKRVLAARIPPLIARPALLGVVVIAAVWLLGAAPVAMLAVAANAVGSLLALAASWWMTRSSMREADTPAVEYRTSEWVRTSLGILSVSIAQIILSQQSDVIVVGTMLGPRPAALYSAAGQVASLVTLGVVTVNHLAAPMIADAHAGGALALRGVVGRVIRLNWLVSLPLALVLLVVGPYLLRTYGREFSDAYVVFVILVLAQSLAAGGGALFGTTLTMTGHQNGAARVAGAAALLNLALTLVLTPRFGVLGTASATLIATLARTLGVYVLARRVLNAQG